MLDKRDWLVYTFYTTSNESGNSVIEEIAMDSDVVDLPSGLRFWGKDMIAGGKAWAFLATRMIIAIIFGSFPILLGYIFWLDPEGSSVTTDLIKYFNPSNPIMLATLITVAFSIVGFIILISMFVVAGRVGYSLLGRPPSAMIAALVSSDLRDRGVWMRRLVL